MRKKHTRCPDIFSGVNEPTAHMCACLRVYVYQIPGAHSHLLEVCAVVGGTRDKWQPDYASGPCGQSFPLWPDETSRRHSVAVAHSQQRSLVIWQSGLKAQILGRLIYAVKTANWSVEPPIDGNKFAVSLVGCCWVKYISRSASRRQWALSKRISAFYRSNGIILQPSNVLTLLHPSGVFLSGENTKKRFSLMFWCCTLWNENMRLFGIMCKVALGK